MKLSSETIRKMLGSIRSTRDQELDCDHCYEELDRFIEMKLSGKNAAEAMPLVEEHLNRCPARIRPGAGREWDGNLGGGPGGSAASHYLPPRSSHHLVGKTDPAHSLGWLA